MVTLSQMLAARESRAAHQTELLAQYHKPLLAFTMNIAGPVKNSPLIRRGFLLGMARLEAQLKRLGGTVLRKEVVDEETGCEAYYAVDLPVKTLKKMAIELEDYDELGRLFDMDVVNEDGIKLSRTAERTCLICGQSGRACARSRAHSVEDLQKKTRQILQNALDEDDCRTISGAAVRALLYEAAVTPKPGLVDRVNTGSHSDMDFFSFLDSISVLQPYFAECFMIGQRTRLLHPEVTLECLRVPGKMAEGKMLCATGGVNTHKGALFLMGILCGAAGRLKAEERFDTDRILDMCAQMGKDLSAKELEQSGDGSTGKAGEFYRDYRIRGIRGEAEAGLPSVKHVGLPLLKQALFEGKSPDEAGVRALLGIMSVTEDTNLIRRGGFDVWKEVQKEADRLCAGEADTEAVRMFDEKLTRENLSPGGSADLLAVCWFFTFLEETVREDAQETFI